MAKLPERYEHLERRDGVVPYSVLSIADCRRAIRRTLPTRHHAKQFFDAVVALLGERAIVDETFAPDDICVHVRTNDDPRLVIGAPLVRLTRGPGQSQTLMRLVNKDAVLPEEAPDGWQPGDPPWAPPTELRPEIVPRGPEMCGGAISIAEGHGKFIVEYDERGVRASGTETGGDTFTWLRRAATAPYHIDTLSRPPSHAPLSMLARAGLDPAGHTVEQLAALVVAGELEQRVAWRVHIPVPVPMTIEGIVRIACSGLRTAMFAGEIPADARWAVADGFEGRAVAWGTTVDGALARFAHAAFAKKPRPPGTSATDEPEAAAPPPPIEPPSTKTSEDGKSTTISSGTIHISIPGRPLKFPWPRAIPANVPAVLLPLPPLPTIPEVLRAAGYVRVVRCIGEHGAIGHVFVRDDDDGYTAVGEHLTDLVEPGELEADLARAEAELDEDLRSWKRDDDDFTQRRVLFTIFDDEHRKRAPARTGNSELAGKLGPPQLDGDLVPWRVVRERRGGTRA